MEVSVANRIHPMQCQDTRSPPWLSFEPLGLWPLFLATSHTSKGTELELPLIRARKMSINVGRPGQVL